MRYPIENGTFDVERMKYALGWLSRENGGSDVVEALDEVLRAIGYTSEQVAAMVDEDDGYRIRLPWEDWEEDEDE